MNRLTAAAGLLLLGCGRLASGPPAALRAPAPPVVVLRGYLDWYSTGMDTLADELRSAGIGAQAYREEQWGDVADALATAPPGPVVLVGFSYGADDTILIARRLDEAHVPVALLITIDPVTPAAVPANVQKCVNFYEPNGFRDVFPWLRGVPLSADANARPPENVNVRARDDLNEPGTSHGTIAGNEKIHAAVVGLVRATRASDR